MPIDTIPGTNRQDAETDVRITTPTVIHMRAMSSSSPGLEGRRPGWPTPAPEVGGRGAPCAVLGDWVTLPRLGRGRPPVFLRAAATG